MSCIRGLTVSSLLALDPYHYISAALPQDRSPPPSHSAVEGKAQHIQGGRRGKQVNSSRYTIVEIPSGYLLGRVLFLKSSRVPQTC